VLRLSLVIPRWPLMPALDGAMLKQTTNLATHMQPRGAGKRVEMAD